MAEAKDGRSAHHAAHHIIYETGGAARQSRDSTDIGNWGNIGEHALGTGTAHADGGTEKTTGHNNNVNNEEMKRYTEEYIERLLAKFMDGTSSVEEESILGEYFRTQGGREEWAEYRRMFAYFDSGMTSLPPAETTQKAHRRFAFLHPKWIAAAAAVAVLTLMVSVWQLKEDSVGQTALAEKNATEVAKEMHRAASTEHSDAASKIDTGIRLAKAQAADEKNDAKTTEKNIHRNIRNNSIASANATNASEIPTKESTAKSQYSIEEKEELKRP